MSGNTEYWSLRKQLNYIYKQLSLLTCKINKCCGGSGGDQNLQQVTDIGSTTDHVITVNGINIEDQLSIITSPTISVTGSDEMKDAINAFLGNTSNDLLNLINPTTVIHVNKASLETTENGSLAYPYKTINAGVFNAPFGSIVLIHSGEYDEDVIVSNKQNIVIKSDSTISQYRTVVNGELIISGTSNRVGIAHLQFNGVYTMSANNALIYGDNFDIRGITNITGSGGYHRYDYAFFERNVNVLGNGTTVDIRSSQFEDASDLIINGLNCAVILTDVDNISAQALDFSLFYVRGSSTFVNSDTAPNIALAITNNVGIVYLEEVSFYQPLTNTYGTIMTIDSYSRIVLGKVTLDETDTVVQEILTNPNNILLSPYWDAYKSAPNLQKVTTSGNRTENDIIVTNNDDSNVRREVSITQDIIFIKDIDDVSNIANSTYKSADYQSGRVYLESGIPEDNIKTSTEHATNYLNFIDTNQIDYNNEIRLDYNGFFVRNQDLAKGNETYIGATYSNGFRQNKINTLPFGGGQNYYNFQADAISGIQLSTNYVDSSVPMGRLYTGASIHDDRIELDLTDVPPGVPIGSTIKRNASYNRSGIQLSYEKQGQTTQTFNFIIDDTITLNASTDVQNKWKEFVGTNNVVDLTSNQIINGQKTWNSLQIYNNLERRDYTPLATNGFTVIKDIKGLSLNQANIDGNIHIQLPITANVMFAMKLELYEYIADGSYSPINLTVNWYKGGNNVIVNQSVSCDNINRMVSVGIGFNSDYSKFYLIIRKKNNINYTVTRIKELIIYNPVTQTILDTYSNSSNYSIEYKTDESGYVASKEILPAKFVSNVEDSGWQTPTLLNGIENYGTTYQVARYRKIGNMVTIEGLVKSASAIPDGTTLFTLPTNYRPLKDLMFSAKTAAAASALIYIRANGNVEGSALNNNYVSFSGIQFYID